MNLPSGRTLRSLDLFEPLGDPKRTADFYELVALQHARLAEDCDPNPTATMANQRRRPVHRAGRGRQRESPRATPARTSGPGGVAIAARVAGGCDRGVELFCTRPRAESKTRVLTHKLKEV